MRRGMFKVVAPRALSDFAVSTLFLATLFVVVLFLHFSINAMLRNAGLAPGLSVTLAGALAFIGVLSVWIIGQDSQARRRRQVEAERAALALPEGPCCVVFRGGEGAEMPWAMTTTVEVAFPRIARRLGIEGVALVEFEIGADGRAKNLHCADVWPHRLFYDAAADALLRARFTARDGAEPRFGPTYRMPFVFRIRGGAAVADYGRRAQIAR